MSETLVQKEMLSPRAAQLRKLGGLSFRKDHKDSKGTKCSCTSLKAVIVAIDDFAGENGHCFATHTNIGQKANLGERTVRRAIEILHQCGLIVKETRRSPASGHKQCRYQIQWFAVDCYIKSFRRDKLKEETKADQWKTERRKSKKPTVMKQGANGHMTATQRSQLPLPNGHSDRTQRSQLPLANGHYDRITAKGTATYLPLQLQGEKTEEEENLNLVIQELEKWLSPPVAARLAPCLSLKQVEEIIVQYQYGLSKGYFRSPGAIEHRIKFDQWPVPQKIPAAAEITAEAKAKKAAVERQKQREAKEAHARELAQENEIRLEAEFGNRLDSLSDAEKLAIAQRSTDIDETTYRQFPGIFRLNLLEAISKTESVEVTA